MTDPWTLVLLHGAGEWTALPSVVSDRSGYSPERLLIGGKSLGGRIWDESLAQAAEAVTELTAIIAGAR